MFGSLCYLSGTKLAQGSWLGESYNEGEGTKCLCERQAAKEVSAITCSSGAGEKEGASSSDHFSCSSSADGDLFRILTFSFLRG